MDYDIRWKQYFGKYKKALCQLNQFIKNIPLNDLEKLGLIHAFEYTHELAWKTLKDFIINKGNTEIYGSKDATREAFSLNIIDNGEVWMQMINSRNLTSHTYNEETTRQILTAILNDYHPAFLALEKKLDTL